jgi:Leucine-rich repeat (LRR) protein
MKNLVLVDLICNEDLTADAISEVFKYYPKPVDYTSLTFPQVSDTNRLLVNVDLSRLLSLDPGQMTSLTELDISGEGLEIIPSQIGDLTELTYLDASHNKLSRLPVELLKLVRLEVLKLNHNNIRTLNILAGSLQTLKSISLVGNPLSVEEKEKIRENLPEGCTVVFEEEL